MILCEYTPCFKPLLNRYDVTYASVYGAVWRYCQGNKHICTATIAAIAERAGVSGAVVASRLNVLEEDGWIESKKVCTKVGWRRVMHLVLNAATMKEEPEEINVDEIEWQHPDAFETPSTEEEDTTPAMVTHPLESVDSPPPEQKKESIEESIEESSKKNSPALLEYYKECFNLKFVSGGKLKTLLSAEEDFGIDTVKEAIRWASAAGYSSDMNRIYNASKKIHSKKGYVDDQNPFDGQGYFDPLAEFIDA